MAADNRILFALRGGVVCAILGSLLGGCAVLLISAIRGDFGLAALSLIPIVFLYAAVTGVPFGLVAGTVGTWWIVARARHISSGRLYYEASATGALIGGSYPLVLKVFGWGPFENLLSTLPISIGAGIVCGLVLTREVLKTPSSR
ncbi:MAG: hypothetical protein WBW91_15690 [Candidatus Sulfotelmatobacter sp.]